MLTSPGNSNYPPDVAIYMSNIIISALTAFQTHRPTLATPSTQSLQGFFCLASNAQISSQIHLREAFLSHPNRGNTSPLSCITLPIIRPPRPPLHSFISSLAHHSLHILVCLVVCLFILHLHPLEDKLHVDMNSVCFTERNLYIVGAQYLWI